jgi:hypothetical protein
VAEAEEPTDLVVLVVRTIGDTLEGPLEEQLGQVEQQEEMDILAVVVGQRRLLPLQVLVVQVVDIFLVVVEEIP